MQVKSLVTTFALAAAATVAHAQDKVSILTSWYAQAEHGGYYQAIATGIYKKHGLDVTVKMGGPQVNSIQLIAAGQADFIMGKDFQTLSALEAGVEAGDFRVDDPTLLANTLYASGLGALQRARVGILVKEAAPGVPTVSQVSPEQVRDYLVASALGIATRRS